jgi:hypothetical protein
VKCDSGLRPEPKGVSEKVNQRICAAELFVGLFTRRNKNEDNTYSTSAWVVEEKAIAISTGKRLMRFGLWWFAGRLRIHSFQPQ